MNIFYPIIAIPADVSEDVPYVIIFMKACANARDSGPPPKREKGSLKIDVTIMLKPKGSQPGRRI